MNLDQNEKLRTIFIKVISKTNKALFFTFYTNMNTSNEKIHKLVLDDINADVFSKVEQDGTYVVICKAVQSNIAAYNELRWKWIKIYKVVVDS